MGPSSSIRAAAAAAPACACQTSVFQTHTRLFSPACRVTTPKTVARVASLMTTQNSCPLGFKLCLPICCGVLGLLELNAQLLSHLVARCGTFVPSSTRFRRLTRARQSVRALLLLNLQQITYNNNIGSKQGTPKYDAASAVGAAAST